MSETETQVLMLTEDVQADNSTLSPLSHHSQSFYMVNTLNVYEFMSVFIKKASWKMKPKLGGVGMHFVVGRTLGFQVLIYTRTGIKLLVLGQRPRLQSRCLCADCRHSPRHQWQMKDPCLLI